jgi:hypothetical protein
MHKKNIVATMVKNKSNKPDFKVPIMFIPEKDKDEDPKEKSVAVKLTTNLAVETLPNPTTEFQHLIKAQWNIISSGYQVCTTL